ncbi:MFS transporter [Natrinema gelatinilyticum]|uniref:MFS transporter n=1 Tax=Natrinema gelatinilyticum TaxID=2961571 RepID=UPI0020C46EDC|nr:MFS transporter [Natrinema gelatinilyticum]
MEQKELGFSPWWLVLVAAAAMGVAGTYQFAWSSIRLPLETRLGASEAAIGTVFTLFVVSQTTVQFPAGWVRDRWGPKLPMLASTVLLAGGYAGTALADSIWGVYLFYSLGGMGVGIVYSVAANTPVKWFDDRRGLATGIAMVAYSGLSFVLIPFVRQFIVTDFVGTLLSLGALAGLVALVAVPILRDPAALTAGDAETDGGADATGADAEPATEPGDADTTDNVDKGYTWREAVQTWQFWLLYGIFVIVNGVTLMLIGKIIAFAANAGISAGAATGAASLVALGDAFGVVIVGGLSDQFGRERTVGVALTLCGVALAGLVTVAEAGIAPTFVALAAVAAFLRAPPYAIFPSLVGEYYGRAHSSANYAVLYSAKLWGGVAGGTVASGLVVSIGWNATFLLGGVLILAAGLATFLLRPVRASPA